MTTADVIATWGMACPAIELQGRWVRNGNWVPTSQALRHADCKAASVTVVEGTEPSTILKIEPVAPDKAPPGKSVSKRPAFYLLVT